MSPRRIGEFLFLMLITVRISAAQQIVNSVFTPLYPNTTYSNPANWSPPEVPNNSPAKNYNVTIRSPAYLDIDATVSNLLIDSESGSLNQQNHSLTVFGTTTINRGPNPYLFPFEDIAIFSFNSSGASFVTDSLSTFSGGALGGRFKLSGSESHLRLGHSTIPWCGCKNPDRRIGLARSPDASDRRSGQRRPA